MRKILILACCLLLVGCSSKKEDTKEQTIIQTDGIVIEEESTTVEETTVATEEVTFTEDKYNNIKTVFENASTINLNQEMINGYSDDSAKTQVIYTANIDTSAKTAEVIIGTSFYDEEEYGGTDNITYLMKDGKYYKKNDDGSEEETDDVSFIGWDISNFSNIYDVFIYLMNGYELPIGVDGYKQGDFEYYTYESEANPSLLEGIDYDKLGKQTIDFTVSTYNDTYSLISFKLRIEYFIGDTSYYCEENLGFLAVS